MTRMRVILEEYGPVVVDIADDVEKSSAGAYYQNVGYMLANGSDKQPRDYYEDKVASFEGSTISGTIVEGPSQLIGEEIEDEPLETDPEVLAAIASDLSFSDSPYDDWE